MRGSVFGSYAISGVVMVAATLLSGCQPSHADTVPVIEITRVPPASEGSPDQLETIEGRVTGALPGQRVVLFARGGAW